MEAAAVTLGEYGLAPRFTAAIKAGEIDMWDATCPAIHAGLQAAEKGVPFMPLRGIIGSDLLRVRPDWKVIDNPLAKSGTLDPIVILPAIRPDVALFHALKADAHGNVWVGVQRELMTAALAIVTGYTSINAVVKAELFPAHIRTLGVALPYAIANAAFGGTASAVALQFKDAGWERGFYWSVTAMIGVSLVTYLWMRDTAKHSKILED